MAQTPIDPASGGRRSLLRTGTLTAAFVVTAALVVMVNYLGWKYHQRFDWTESRLYSLSSKSENVLSGLDHDVEAVAFLSPGDPLYEPTRELLNRYEAASPRFSVRFLDPAKNPRQAQQLAERYDVRSASVVLVSGDDSRVILQDSLAELDYSQMQMGGGAEISAFKGEQVITGALVELSDARKPQVLFTTGHGEIRLDDFSGTGLNALSQRLRDENFEVEEWSSLGADAVPAGTDLVVIAGPTSPFLPPEVELLSGYLDRGGRMLVLLDPVLSPTGDGTLVDSGLEEWLTGWGVEVARDIVVDPPNTVPFFGSETLFVNRYGAHPLTDSVRQGDLPVMVSLVRSVAAADAPEGLRVTELMRTSDAGWGETDISSVEVEQGPEDLAGPVPLAVVVEAEAAGEPEDDPVGELDDGLGGDAGDEAGTAADDGEVSTDDGDSGAPSRGGARLVVFGDSDFASDELIRNPNNAVLTLDTLNWLAERETLLGIPPKEPERVRLSLDATQMSWIYAFVLLVLPGLAVISGVAVYYRRRR